MPRAASPATRRTGPTGTRTVWLAELELADELWARFAIPIGLAFFFRSSAAGGVVALYPSPAGATECELDLAAWERARRRQPGAATSLEPDVEALIVNRLGGARQHAIVADRRVLPAGRPDPGAAGRASRAATPIEDAVDGFFAELRERAP